jgi:hypothetical protein
MPNYVNSPFAPPVQIAIPAVPAYFFGSLPVDTDDTYMRVTNVSIATNVASVVGTIYRGNIPAVGNFISIQGTTSNSGIFNVSQATITGVTGTPSTGVYTITFALTNANITATADSGLAIIPIAEVPEAVANGTSVAIYVPSNELRDLGQRSITVATSFPSLPTAAVVTLYTAINNNPQAASPEWTEMGIVATVSGGAVTVPANASTGGGLATFSTPAGRFFRVVVSGASGGTSPTLVCKMVC